MHFVCDDKLADKRSRHGMASQTRYTTFVKACGVVAVDEEVPWHDLLTLPLLLPLPLYCKSLMLGLNRGEQPWRILQRLLVPAHVLLGSCLIKSFALHVACSLAKEIIWMLLQEVVLRIWKMPMMEAADVGKSQVFHLTQKRALQAQMYVICG